MWTAVIPLAIALCALAAWPVLAERRRGLPDPGAAPGRLVRLSQGTTHFRWIGPARGPVIVAIHGIATPSPLWEALAAGLAGTGYRVLVYDLYGRGFSEAVPGRQDQAFFLRQLEDLLADQGLAEDLTLLGYSMGGVIATAFAAARPERMKRLILLAPAGIEVAEDRRTRFCREIPLLGDWLWAVTAPAGLRAAAARTRAEGSEVEGIAEVQEAELARRGFLSAVLSSRRHTLMLRQEAAHRAIGLAAIPVVALWGERDRLIPLRGLGTLAAWNRTARQEVIPGAGHGLPHTHAGAVTAILRGILRED
jgi:pimeloyl-ACP methyl ester carboxylesterase